MAVGSFLGDDERFEDVALVRSDLQHFVRIYVIVGVGYWLLAEFLLVVSALLDHFLLNHLALTRSRLFCSMRLLVSSSLFLLLVDLMLRQNITRKVPSLLFLPSFPLSDVWSCYLRLIHLMVETLYLEDTTWSPYSQELVSFMRLLFYDYWQVSSVDLLLGLFKHSRRHQKQMQLLSSLNAQHMRTTAYSPT